MRITRRRTFPWSRSSPGWHRHCASLDGSQPPYFLIAELSFASQEAFEAAMAAPEGHAAGADVPNFATGGVTMFIAHD